MCETLGYEVMTLKRERIMNVTLDGIAEGTWRYLTSTEINEIQLMVEKSKKTEDASNLNQNDSE